MTNNDLKKSINIKECVKEIHTDTVTENMNKNIKGKQHIPTKYDIMKSFTFGKPSIDHSFTGKVCFEHVIIFILKREFLHKLDNENLLGSHPLIKHLDKMLNLSNNIQFMELKNSIKLCRLNFSRHI